MPFATIEEAAVDLRDGKMIIIVDDEDRENEGDLVCAAEKVTPAVINFMAMHGRGLICLPLTEERCDELRLHPQASENTSSFGTAFTVSIEARHGITTGISAADRATTILTAVNPQTTARDLARPGHIFPLRARAGGVLVRPGQTEASVDLARIAGLSPAGVICEIMNADGTMARLPQLEVFAAQHDMKIVSVADVVRYRIRTETLVRCVAEGPLPTAYGTFQTKLFENVTNGETHVAMVLGEVRTDEPTLVRVHTENVTFAMFGSLIGGAGAQLQTALTKIAEAERGVVLYLRQREHNLGLVHQLKTYALMQETGLSLSDARRETGYGAYRDYGIGAQILHELGLRRITLLSDNPPHIAALEGFGLEYAGHVRLSGE